jgi:hypothetical protein
MFGFDLMSLDELLVVLGPGGSGVDLGRSYVAIGDEIVDQRVDEVSDDILLAA